MREYLYIDQLAELTPWTPEAIRTMISRGTFKLGVHYYKPQGRSGRPIFLWAAVVEFIEKGGAGNEPLDDQIRLTDGSVLDLDEATSQVHRLLG